MPVAGVTGCPMTNGPPTVVYARGMGRSILVAVLVAVGCAIIVFGLGRLLDSETLKTVAVAAGAGAGIGYFITTRTGPRESGAGTKRGK